LSVGAELSLYYLTSVVTRCTVREFCSSALNSWRVYKPIDILNGLKVRCYLPFTTRHGPFTCQTLNFTITKKDMDIKNNILETIGNTPLIKLNKVTKDFPCPVLAKVD